jgi:hypothetical protein
MTKIYAVGDKDFTCETEALAYAASHAGDEWCNVITFIVEHNLPGLKPDLVHRSCALRKVYADGVVVSCNIF